MGRQTGNSFPSSSKLTPSNAEESGYEHMRPIWVQPSKVSRTRFRHVFSCCHQSWYAIDALCIRP